MDPLTESMNSWSPYNYTFNNPILFVDPSGMVPTDLYDNETGEHLEHINDGIDEAIAVNKSSYEGLKEENNMSNESVKGVGGISLGSNTEFEKISATLYAEAGTNPNEAESAAIFDVLENRTNSTSGSGKTEMQIIEAGGIYGYKSDDYNAAMNQKSVKRSDGSETGYSKARHNKARRGAMIGMTNGSLDFSNGAYFWEGNVYLNNPNTYTSNFFNKVGHGTTKGSKTGNYTFEYTVTIGPTTFMRYNQQLYPNKTWK